MLPAVRLHTRAEAPVTAPLVLRVWALRPEARIGAEPEPLLAGVLGVPWRDATLEARCTIEEPNANAFPTIAVTRQHPVVPDPACSCGIYGSTDPSRLPAADLVPPGRPVVVGFVELGGRIVRRGTVLRAARARVVGPLVVTPGRPPLLARLARRARPSRVVVERDAYRVVWGRTWTGRPWEEWVAATAHHLYRRYRVEVLG